MHAGAPLFPCRLRQHKLCTLYSMPVSKVSFGPTQPQKVALAPWPTCQLIAQPFSLTMGKLPQSVNAQLPHPGMRPRKLNWHYPVYWHSGKLACTDSQLCHSAASCPHQARLANLHECVALKQVESVLAGLSHHRLHSKVTIIKMSCELVSFAFQLACIFAVILRVCQAPSGSQDFFCT